MKLQALPIIFVLAALLACKKKEAPSPTPVVTTTTAAAPEAAADTWTSFKSAEGNFEVRAPAVMKSQTSPTQTAVGELEMHLFTTTQSSVTYQVAYSDWPPKMVKAKSVKALLQGGEEGTMKAMNTTATSSSAIKVDGHPGREFSAAATVEGIELDYYGRMFFVKNRLFQLQVLGPKGTVSETDRKKFVDSFQLAE